MNSGKNLSRSKLIIVVQICAVVMKNVSGTKMIILTNCEKSEEMRGLSAVIYSMSYTTTCDGKTTE
jgi:hypothetical protein